MALGGTLSPSSRKRSPERGAGDAQRRGDGFSHAPFPCLDPGPSSVQELATGSCKSFSPLVLPVGFWGELAPQMSVPSFAGKGKAVLCSDEAL